jgi:hypothetical protein
MNKSSIIPQIKKSYPQNKPRNILGFFWLSLGGDLGGVNFCTYK